MSMTHKMALDMIEAISNARATTRKHQPVAELIGLARVTLAPWPSSDLPSRLLGEAAEVEEAWAADVPHYPMPGDADPSEPSSDFIADPFFAEAGDVLLTLRNMFEARYPGRDPDELLRHALHACAVRFFHRSAAAAAFRDARGLDSGHYDPTPSEWAAIKAVLG